MTKEIRKPTELDPCELSKEWLVVVQFLQSPSPQFKLAASMAASATFYTDFLIEKKKIILAGYDKTQKDLTKLKTLIPIIEHWKGTMFYVAGRPLNLKGDYFSWRTIDCYLLSLSCKNYQAHCWDIIEHPLYKRDEDDLSISISLNSLSNNKELLPLLLNPCKNLDLSRLHVSHPASLLDLAQAKAVNQNIDWCPNFHPEDLKKLMR